MNRTARIALAVIGAAALVAGCSGSGSDSASSSTTSSSDVTGDLTVFAAASLKSTFTTLGEQFESAHPGTTVTFNFAGSSDLVTQLTQGAPADVFASADEKNMTKAVDAGLLPGDPVNFATNTLTIVTPPGNPKGVASFADLAKPGVSVVVCAPQVPCGSATKKVEDATGVTLTPVSEESAVTDVLGKITSGQADAGLVYVTDAKGAGDEVTAVEFPESSDAVNTYPITVLTSAQNAAAAGAFVDLVTGADGQRVLADAGFSGP
ncbi:molybdate ABC transporter substrate-binding protein [Mycolicibacterium sediminis]|uniref:molybdate ABC transporter substrate-binding protein n=1 Tax=Mycolicibacterium sediminis TaxID=1286180 RepID=UPI0013D61716|nr:molybdate ABC transporter substrate-binding protein [Mycolicibacterium sediminis]